MAPPRSSPRKAKPRRASGPSRTHAQWTALGYTRVAVWLDAPHLAMLDRLADELAGSRRDAIEAMLEADERERQE